MTVLVAILLALGVPFAQLHTVNDRVSCCCPDPEQCKCPDHEPSTQSQMGTCHKLAGKTMRAQLAAFVPPVVVDVIAPAPQPIVVAYAHPVPHAPPPPQRPAAPS